MNTKISGSGKSPDATRYLTPLGVWALSFGGIIGWGSFVMPGNMFLPNAGTVGTILAVVLGGLVMLIIGKNFCVMAERFPDNGGIFTYTRHILGHDHSFLAAWSVTLAYLSLIWANATAFVLISRYIFGDFLQFGFHYRIAGYDVFLGEILLTWEVIILFGLVACYLRNFARKFHIALAVFLLVSVIALFVGIYSQTGNIPFSPAFQEEAVSPVMQIFSIFMIAPWMFVGFEAITHTGENFSFPAKKLYPIIIAAVFCGVLVYCLLNTLAVMKIPAEYSSWSEYIANLKNLSGYSALPVFNSVNSVFGSTGIIILTCSVFAALSTSLLGFYLVSAQILKAMAKDDLMPAKFAETSEDGTPRKAIMTIMTVSLIIPFFGRTAIAWLTDVTTITASIAYGYVSLCNYITAKETGNKRQKIFGLSGLVLSFCFFFFPILPNFLYGSALNAESYLLLAAWSIGGFFCYRYTFKHDKQNRFGKSTAMCMMILFLNFFSTAMWMRQVKEDHIKFILGTSNEVINNTLTLHTTIHMVMIAIILILMSEIFTIMKEREKELNMKIIQEQERSRAKTNFLSNMSHDIRTPMNAIIGYIELSKDLHKLCENCPREHCPDNVPQRLYEFINKIETSSRHLLALINDVLEMSRIENGKTELNESENDIVLIVREVGEIFSSQMRAKKIEFLVDTLQVKNNIVICDFNLLNRILLNLIGNACKFTPEGGRVSVDLIQTYNEIPGLANYQLRVKDNGIGMSEEFAEKIFEPFTRERTSTVSGIQGTGLGMAITKNFTDLMGGKISVNTKQGEGTEFVLDFLFAIVDKPEVVPTENISLPEPETDFSDKKILLVEDIDVNREIAIMILTGVGFQVDYSVNGKEAVEKISASQPGDFDLILMDIQMPVMDGYEATRKIRALENPELAKIPIIAMTANAFSEDVERAKKAGMNAHIAKPLDLPQMMKTISKFLNRR